MFYLFCHLLHTCSYLSLQIFKLFVHLLKFLIIGQIIIFPLLNHKTQILSWNSFWNIFAQFFHIQSTVWRCFSLVILPLIVLLESNKLVLWVSAYIYFYNELPFLLISQQAKWIKVLVRFIIKYYFAFFYFHIWLNIWVGCLANRALELWFKVLKVLYGCS